MVDDERMTSVRFAFMADDERMTSVGFALMVVDARVCAFMVVYGTCTLTTFGICTLEDLMVSAASTALAKSDSKA
jgi:hypothetical protein